MTKYVPPSFDEARVLEGLKKAMGFGEPTRDADKVTFYFNERSQATGPVDEDGVPFDPEERIVNERPEGVRADCAVEYVDRADQPQTFGSAAASRVILTLLDPDYQQVKGFAYVVAGGDVYRYRSTEPPSALGTIDVWTVICVAEDEL